MKGVFSAILIQTQPTETEHTKTGLQKDKNKARLNLKTKEKLCSHHQG